MPRTHAEVAEAARETAFEEARATEQANYKRDLTNRISAAVGRIVTQMIGDEGFTRVEPKLDFVRQNNGIMRISVHVYNPRKLHATVNVEITVDG